MPSFQSFTKIFHHHTCKLIFYCFRTQKQLMECAVIIFPSVSCHFRQGFEHACLTVALLLSLLTLCRCPWLSDYFSSVIPIYNAVIFLFTLANFCMATFMDPGIFPRGKQMLAVFVCKYECKYELEKGGPHMLMMHNSVISDRYV